MIAISVGLGMTTGVAHRSRRRATSLQDRGHTVAMVGDGVNLGWAAGDNRVTIPPAAGVGIVLSPAVGAVLMSLSTVVVALKAQLLRRVDLRVA